MLNESYGGPYAEPDAQVRTIDQTPYERLTSRINLQRTVVETKKREAGRKQDEGVSGLLAADMAANAEHKRRLSEQMQQVIDRISGPPPEMQLAQMNQMELIGTALAVLFGGGLDAVPGAISGGMGQAERRTDMANKNQMLRYEQGQRSGDILMRQLERQYGEADRTGERLQSRQWTMEDRTAAREQDKIERERREQERDANLYRDIVLNPRSYSPEQIRMAAKALGAFPDFAIPTEVVEANVRQAEARVAAEELQRQLAERKDKDSQNDRLWDDLRMAKQAGDPVLVHGIGTRLGLSDASIAVHKREAERIRDQERQERDLRMQNTRSTMEARAGTQRRAEAKASSDNKPFQVLPGNLALDKKAASKLAKLTEELNVMMDEFQAIQRVPEAQRTADQRRKLGNLSTKIAVKTSEIQRIEAPTYSSAKRQTQKKQPKNAPSYEFIED